MLPRRKENAMKTTKRLLSVMLAILMIFCMALTQPVQAIDSSDEWVLTEQQVIEAVQPLTMALAEYYTIGTLNVIYVSQTTNENNTIDLECHVVYPMCLKADNVEDLPYVSGMMARSGYETLSECKMVLQNANINAESLLSTSATRPIVTETTAVAYKMADFLYDVEESIGEVYNNTYPVIIKLDENGDITDVLGVVYKEVVPLSDFYPEDADTMFAQGYYHANEIIASASQTVADLNYAGYLYYRVDARNYANRWVGDISYNYNGVNTKQDTRYYNPAYRAMTDNDCANYVSQAIHYGGIPQSASWRDWETNEEYNSSYHGAWYNVRWLRNYLLYTLGIIESSDWTWCNAGGIIMGTEEDMTHTMMCVHNDTVTRYYSAHTDDDYRMPYTSGLTALYYIFKNSTTESQYEGADLLSSREASS